MSRTDSWLMVDLVVLPQVSSFSPFTYGDISISTIIFHIFTRYCNQINLQLDAARINIFFFQVLS